MDLVYIVRDGEKLYVFTNFDAAEACCDDLGLDAAYVIDCEPQDCYDGGCDASTDE